MTATNDHQAVVRLPSSVLKDVDDIARRLSKPGCRVTRSTVMRMMILHAAKDPSGFLQDASG